MADEIILRNYGGYDKKNFASIIRKLFDDNDNEQDKISLATSYYFTHDTFIDKLINQKTKFCMLSLNIQSINAKFNKLLLLIEELREYNFEFGAICLQETWLEEGADLTQFHIPNYTCIAQGKSSSQHGGLMTYIHNDYNYEKYTSPDHSNTWEDLVIRILNKNNHKDIYLCNIYRPPKGNITNEILATFTEEITTLLSDLKRSRSVINVLGDFNIDLLQINDKVIIKQYFENMMTLSMYPKITLPTRITDASATLIDNIFCNSNNDKNETAGILLSDLSDHFPYFYAFKDKMDYKKDIYSKKVKYIRDINQDSKQNLFNSIKNKNIINNLLLDDNIDPNINYNILENILTECLNESIPLKQIRMNKYKFKKTDWITNGLIKSIRYRDNLYRNMRILPPGSVLFMEAKQNLKVYNRILKRSIRAAKISFYTKKFDFARSNSRETWNIINKVLNRSKANQFPEYITINQSKVTDKTSIVNHFNEYFGKIGSTMASNIPTVNNAVFTDYLQANINTNFKFVPVTIAQVSKIIKQISLKNSVGYDGISNNLLKFLEPILLNPLTVIINQSLKSGIFPDKLKVAKIIPIHKKDDTDLCENYRPISILPAISKIFEKVVYDQIYSYFLQNELFCKNQYGFKKQHSTEHAVLEAVDRISSGLDSEHTPIAVYLDLSKAFDTLNHNILISKLKYYGFNENSLDWFKSYLSNRTHFVDLNYTKSNMVENSVGVPQGSILGPLLFSIYINDIQNSTKYFDFIKYADDTSLINSNICIGRDNLTIINDELNKVYTWLCTNRLSLNIKKTKFMIFHNKNKKIIHLVPNITINNIMIERVEDFNFLGITINEMLNWNTHISKLSTKVSKSIGILYKLKSF